MQPDYNKLPACVRGPIERYVEQGIPPGYSLTKVLQHDLMAVCACDDETVAVLPQIMRWLHCEAPSLCHGNPARVAAWTGKGGRQGKAAA